MAVASKYLEHQLREVPFDFACSYSYTNFSDEHRGLSQMR